MLNKDAFRVKENQHAFSHGCSTASALVKITQTWLNDSENTTEGKKAIHSLFIDFSKAFDLVDHSILLSKLKGRNINRSLWQWIQSFLQGRMQQVKLPGVLSTTQTCPVGLPQGSVISPLLFSIFIDDFNNSIPVELQGHVKMCTYTDDCTASKSIPNGKLSNMQKVLDGLQNWATTNKMLLNSKKTKDMWISFCKNSIKPHLLQINDSRLERVSKFKLLRVWQQDNLCWNYHVELPVKKARKRLYFGGECRKANIPTEISITIYCTKICPLLEYASPLWSGFPKYLAEEVQVYKTGV